MQSLVRWKNSLVRARPGKRSKMEFQSAPGSTWQVVSGFYTKAKRVTPTRRWKSPDLNNNAPIKLESFLLGKFKPRVLDAKSHPAYKVKVNKGKQSLQMTARLPWCLHTMPINNKKMLRVKLLRKKCVNLALKWLPPASFLMFFLINLAHFALVLCCVLCRNGSKDALKLSLNWDWMMFSHENNPVS